MNPSQAFQPRPLTGDNFLSSVTNGPCQAGLPGETDHLHSPLICLLCTHQRMSFEHKGQST